MPHPLLLIDRQPRRRTQLRATLAEAGGWAVKEAAEPSIARLLAQAGVAAVLCEAWAVPQGPAASCAWGLALTGGRAPVLVLADAGLPLDREAVFAAGASDLLPLPVSAAELGRRVGLQLRLRDAEQEVTALQDQLRHLSLHDPLTGLINREHFLLACRRELAAVGRHGLPLAACMMDLDDNDGALGRRVGLAAADAMVMTVGQRLESQLRAGDTLSRLGGERFCALLPQTPLETAGAVAERLRLSVTDLACTRAGRVTVSLGVAVAGAGAGLSVDGLLAAAEAQLLAARAAGGNRLRA